MVVFSNENLVSKIFDGTAVCLNKCMTINIPIDEALIQEAKALAGQQTERDVVEEALREYVQRRKQRMILDLFGTIDYDVDYNYKQQRQQP